MPHVAFMNSSTQMPPDLLDAQRDEQAWLRFFLLWQTPVLTIFSVITLIWFVSTGSSRWGLSTAAQLWLVAVLLWARLQVRAGRLARASTGISSGFLAGGVLAVLLAPEILPLAVLFPLGAVIITLPYLDTSLVRRMIGMASVAIVAIVALAGTVQLFSPLELFVGLPLKAAILLAVFIMFWLLWQYHNRLVQLLMQARAAHHALQRSYDDLEAQVHARTRELQASESRYRAISELMSDYVYALSITPDGHGTLEWATDAFERISGYPPAELVAAGGWRVLIHADDLPTVERRVADLLAGQPAVIEYRIRTREGGIRWLSDSARPEWDAEHRQVVRVLGAVQDVTARKQAEERLRRLAAQRQWLLEVGQMLLATLSTDEVLRRIRRTLASVVESDQFCLYWLDSAANLLRPAVVAGATELSGALAGWTIPSDHGIIGAVIRSGRGELVNNAHLDPRSIYPAGVTVTCEHMICAPIRTHERVIGAFVISRSMDQPFTEEEFELVLLLMSYASLAIVNARLYEQTRESEARYRTLFEESKDVVFISTPAGGLVDINPAGVALFGFPSKEAILGVDTVRALYKHPEDRELLKYLLEQQGYVQDYELALKRADGQELIVLETATVVRNEAGGAVAYRGMMRDITARRQAELALQEANQQLTTWVRELESRTREMALLNQMGDLLQACRTVDEAYVVIGQSAQALFAATSGVLYMIRASQNTVEAAAFWGATPPGEVMFTPDACWALRRGRMHLVESNIGLRCSHMQAAPETCAVCVPLMAHGEALGVLHIRGDATEPHRQLAVTVAEHIALALANLRLRETLRYQAIRDPLTGLFNRRYMEESLEREVQRAARHGTPLAIVMLDIDYFKRFNDTFGHTAGDTLLRELGAFLQRHIRGEDIACRYGGEEFTLILPDATLDDVWRRAEEFREAAHHLHVYHRDQFLGPITISLGIAMFPLHGTTAETLVRAADEALYVAKTTGRNRAVVSNVLL